MGIIQHTVSVTLRDGSTKDHTAVFTRFVEGEASGLIVVEACCCNDPKTASRHTLPNDVTLYTADQISAEIAEHVQRVAAHHASVHKAKDLMQSLTDSLQPISPI